jgi:hypothetical protein
VISDVRHLAWGTCRGDVLGRLPRSSGAPIWSAETSPVPDLLLALDAPQPPPWLCERTGDTEKGWLDGVRLLENQLSGLETSAAMPAAAQAVPFILELRASQAGARRRTRLWHLLTRLCSAPVYGEHRSPVDALCAQVPALIVALRSVSGIEAVALIALLRFLGPDPDVDAALWAQTGGSGVECAAALLSLSTRDSSHVAEAAAVFLDGESQPQATTYAALALTLALEAQVDRRAIERLAFTTQPVEPLACGFSAPLRRSLPQFVGSALGTPDRVAALLAVAPALFNDASRDAAQQSDSIALFWHALGMSFVRTLGWSEDQRAALRLFANSPAWRDEAPRLSEALNNLGLPSTIEQLLHVADTGLR